MCCIYGRRDPEELSPCDGVQPSASLDASLVPGKEEPMGLAAYGHGDKPVSLKAARGTAGKEGAPA